MLTTGFQLRAARSLIGMDQNVLADRAKLNVNTIRSMEAGGPASIAGRAANVQAVQRALEAAGVEFLNHGQPGVRLRKVAIKSKPDDGLSPGQTDDSLDADRMRGSEP